MLIPKLPLCPDTLICNWEGISCITNKKFKYATVDKQGIRLGIICNNINMVSCNPTEIIWHFRRIQHAVTLNGTWEMNDSWGRVFSVTKEDFTCPAVEEIFMLLTGSPRRPAVALRGLWCWNFLPSLVSALWWRNRRCEAMLSDSWPAQSWW